MVMKVNYGWSSYIPKHNPKDITDLLNLKLMVKTKRLNLGEGFKGSIKSIENEYMSEGSYNVILIIKYKLQNYLSKNGLMTLKLSQ